MAKRKHSALGKRLIASAKEMVAHAKGEIELDTYEVKVPPQVDVTAIRKRFGLSQAEFARRFGFSPRAVQDWEQGDETRSGRATFRVAHNQPSKP